MSSSIPCRRVSRAALTAPSRRAAAIAFQADAVADEREVGAFGAGVAFVALEARRRGGGRLGGAAVRRDRAGDRGIAGRDDGD